MTIQAAANKKRGVHTFYIQSESGNKYVVQQVRRAGIRTISCSCPDFIYRGSTKASHRACKHIKAVREEQAKRLRNIRIEKELREGGGEIIPSVSDMTRTMLEAR